MDPDRRDRPPPALPGDAPTVTLTFSAPYDRTHEAARAALARIPRLVVTGQEPETGEIRAVRRALVPWVRDDVRVRVSPSGGRVAVSVSAAARGTPSDAARLDRTVAEIRAALEQEVLERARGDASREG